MGNFQFNENDINKALAGILSFICKNPLLFVSESDIQSFVANKLMEVDGLGINNLYETNVSIGLNQQNELSKEKYKTIIVHKEYGLEDMPNSRCDIAILNPTHIAEIDDPLNLKVNKKWIKPDYILEFGTEKSAGSAEIFRGHLCNDIKKTVKSKIKGYVIHIHRNWIRSGGGHLENNREKYKDYEDVINNNLDTLEPYQKLIIVLVEIGNKGRSIAKEGKIKLFDLDEKKFKGVNLDKIEDKIFELLR